MPQARVFRLRQPRRRNPRRPRLAATPAPPSGWQMRCLSGASEAAQRDAEGNARHARQRQPADQSGPFQPRLQGASVLMCGPAAAWRAVGLTGEVATPHDGIQDGITRLGRRGASFMILSLAMNAWGRCAD